jgi:hypothetical protein
MIYLHPKNKKIQCTQHLQVLFCILIIYIKNINTRSFIVHVIHFIIQLNHVLCVYHNFISKFENSDSDILLVWIIIRI